MFVVLTIVCEARNEQVSQSNRLESEEEQKALESFLNAVAAGDVKSTEKRVMPARNTTSFYCSKWHENLLKIDDLHLHFDWPWTGGQSSEWAWWKKTSPTWSSFSSHARFKARISVYNCSASVVLVCTWWSSCSSCWRFNERRSCSSLLLSASFAFN